MRPSRQDLDRAPRRSTEERRALILDTAARLFTADGVHAVGMDRLVSETGLGKMSVYRVFASKDDLIEAYLRRMSGQILTSIDQDIDAGPDGRSALHAILDGVEDDLRRPDFRGCPFGNAAGEFAEPAHPARQIARAYRLALLHRLQRCAESVDAARGSSVARQLAVLIDGAYLSAAHLGLGGPASDGLGLARDLVDAL